MTPDPDGKRLRTYLFAAIGYTPEEISAASDSAQQFQDCLRAAIGDVEKVILREKKSRDTTTEQIWRKMPFGLQSFVTMFSIKTERMVAALRNGDVNIDDSLLDLAAYAILCMAWIKLSKQQLDAGGEL